MQAVDSSLPAEARVGVDVGVVSEAVDGDAVDDDAVVVIDVAEEAVVDLVMSLSPRNVPGTMVIDSSQPPTPAGIVADGNGGGNFGLPPSPPSCCCCCCSPLICFSPSTADVSFTTTPALAITLALLAAADMRERLISYSECTNESSVSSSRL